VQERFHALKVPVQAVWPVHFPTCKAVETSNQAAEAPRRVAGPFAFTIARPLQIVGWTATFVMAAAAIAMGMTAFD